MDDRLVVAAEDEQRERGRVVPDRGLGFGSAELERPARGLLCLRPSRPARTSAFIAPIGRPQLPAGASAMLSR